MEDQGSALPLRVPSSSVSFTPCFGMLTANVNSPEVLSHLRTNYDCKATSIECRRSLCWAQLFCCIATALMYFLCLLACI